MTKVGLFFGSFDPIHIGHINVATSILNMKLVDEINFVVAYSNPWKTTQTPFEDRCKMVDLACPAYQGKVYISEVEKIVYEKYGITCTYKVLEEILKTHKHTDCEFIIITTQETYAEIPNWKNGKDIINNNKFIIITSDHFGMFDFVPKDEDVLIDIKDIPICSTTVRNMAANKQILIPYVPQEVEEYIYAKQLYKEKIQNTNEEEDSLT